MRKTVDFKEFALLIEKYAKENGGMDFSNAVRFLIAKALRDSKKES